MGEPRETIFHDHGGILVSDWRVVVRGETVPLDHVVKFSVRVDRRRAHEQYSLFWGGIGAFLIGVVVVVFAIPNRELARQIGFGILGIPFGLGMFIASFFLNPLFLLVITAKGGGRLVKRSDCRGALDAAAAALAKAIRYGGKT